MRRIQTKWSQRNDRHRFKLNNFGENSEFFRIVLKTCGRSGDSLPLLIEQPRCIMQEATNAIVNWGDRGRFDRMRSLIIARRAIGVRRRLRKDLNYCRVLKSTLVQHRSDP